MWLLTCCIEWDTEALDRSPVHHKIHIPFTLTLTLSLQLNLNGNCSSACSATIGRFGGSVPAPCSLYVKVGQDTEPKSDFDAVTSVWMGVHGEVIMNTVLFALLYKAGLHQTLKHRKTNWSQESPHKQSLGYSRERTSFKQANPDSEWAVICWSWVFAFSLGTQKYSQLTYLC